MFPDVKRLLLSRPALAALISGVYPGFVPADKALPAVSAFMVSQSITDAIDDSPPAITSQNWQINAVATTAQDADAVARQVIAATHKQSGAGISYALTTNRRDEPPATGGTVHRVIIEATITA